MQDFQARTAVITGAGSGFGREFARACAREGMNLVLADVQAGPLEATCALPEVAAAPHLSQLCDVGNAVAVEALASAAYARFGAVHLLFNNAGIAVGGPLWTATLDEWKWALDVNLMGVVHGIRSFVPRMLEQATEAHVVNTASAAGLLAPPGSGVYAVTKHAVVVLSEVLHHELRMAGSRIGVSVLCPAFVNTGIADPQRLRPPGLQINPHPLTQRIEQGARKAVRKAKLGAEEIAAMTLQAVREQRFCILPHPSMIPAVQARVQHLVEGLPPHDSNSVNPY